MIKPIKQNNDMKNNLFKYLVFPLLFMAVASCTGDDISMPAGQLPDEAPMSIVGGQLCSERTLSRMLTVNLYEGDEEHIEKISYSLTKPALGTTTLKVVANELLVNTYNDNHQSHMEPLPTTNVRIDDDGVLTIAKGKKISAPIKLAISSEGLKSGTLYLLAITLEQVPMGIELQTEKQVLYYRIGFREKVTTTKDEGGYLIDIPPLLPNITSVFYVNTETYQPLIVAAWGIKADDFGSTPPVYSLGNIVNLKKATIDYNVVNQRTSLKLGSDLCYVLEHRDKYIRHLLEYGRKVCICIENGGKGVGFCNMTDAQIVDFVGQVKEVVNRYQLDGVNLWDEDSKYGKEGMPALNTVSYPKLIKALRNALPDKLLTLVDKGNATKYFYDSGKCAGIKVGEYIDYAWHGYASSKDDLQIINPDLKENTQAYSKYTRKPIAGLDEKCYGSVNIPLYLNNDSQHRELMYEMIAQWKTERKKNSDILVFGFDLIGQEYAEMEGAVMSIFDSSFAPFMDDGDSWDFDIDDFEYGLYMYVNYLLDAQVGNPIDNGYHKDW